MDRIQTQASELWDIIFSEETAATYQKALNLTGTILKEAAQLIWLVICSFFVFGAWVGDTSVRAGQSIRTWIDQQGTPGSAPSTNTSLAEKGKSLLDTGREGIAYLLDQAREQVGVEPTSMPTIAPSSKPAQQPTPAPSAEPVETPVEANSITSVSADNLQTDSDNTDSNNTDSNDIESAAASVPPVATSYGTGYGSTSRTVGPEDDSWPPQEKQES